MTDWLRPSWPAFELHPECGSNFIAQRAGYTRSLGVARPFFYRIHHFGENSFIPSALEACHLRDCLKILASEVITLAVDRHLVAARPQSCRVIRVGNVKRG